MLGPISATHCLAAGIPAPHLSLMPPPLHGVMERTRAQKRVPYKILSRLELWPADLPAQQLSMLVSLFAASTTPLLHSCILGSYPKQTSCTQAFVSCPAFQDTQTGTSSNSYRRNWIVMSEKEDEYKILWEYITRGKSGGKTIRVEN